MGQYRTTDVAENLGKFLSGTQRICQGKDFEVILTVKIETRHPIGKRSLSNNRHCVDRAKNLPGPVPNIHSQCSIFHPNPFTFGGVIANHVKAVLWAHWVNWWAARSEAWIRVNNSVLYLVCGDHEIRSKFYGDNSPKYSLTFPGHGHPEVCKIICSVCDSL